MCAFKSRFKNAYASPSMTEELTTITHYYYLRQRSFGRFC